MQCIYFETKLGAAYIIPNDRMIMRSDGGSFSISTSPQLFTAVIMDSICYFPDSEKAFQHLKARAAERAAEIKRDAPVAKAVPASALPKQR